MARLYESTEGESAGCPGQNKCETWLSSADDQPAKFRCPSCPKLRESEPEAVAIGIIDNLPESWNEELLLDRVDRLRQERNSGRAIYELMQPLEWELLLIWDEYLETYKRSHDVFIARTMSSLVAALTVR